MANIAKRIDNHKAKVHRTGHFQEDQIAHLRKSANRQEKIIARIFWQAKPEGLAPSEAHKLAIGSEAAGWPLTSTRRAISNLTDDHILIKTDRTKEGTYGRPECIWRWKEGTDFKMDCQQGDMFGRQKPQHQGAYSQ